MNERDKVIASIKAIAESKFHEYYFSDKSYLQIMDELAFEVLNIKGLAILADNQRLPTVEWTAAPDSTSSVAFQVAEGFARAYAEANFRRIEK